MKLFNVARPVFVNVVTPLMAPFVTSQVSEAISILSPPSPMVRVAVVVQVPSTLLL